MRFTILTAVLLSAAPAFAGGEAQVDELAHAAKRYRQATWPEAGPARRGVAPTTVKVAGWDRVSLALDPRRGEAHLGFARRVEQKQARRPARRQATARLTLRVHADAARARRALLAVLAANQSVLAREEGWGEVAFGKRQEGRLGYLAFVQGNVTAVVRAPGLEAKALADAAQAAIQASAPLETAAQGEALAPRATGAELGVRKGRATPLKLRFDAARPQAVEVALDVRGGSVLRAKTGYVLYAAPGAEVTITVHTCSKELRAGRQVFTLRAP